MSDLMTETPPKVKPARAMISSQRIAETRGPSRPARAARGRGEDRFHRLRDPRQVRHRLRARLRGALSRAAGHLFVELEPHPTWPRSLARPGPSSPQWRGGELTSGGGGAVGAPRW